MTVKSSINCDQVFDRLTQGRFPSGRESDSQIEKHIRFCNSCREFAEAMRPAIDLIHESADEYKSDDLPSCQMNFDSIPVGAFGEEIVSKDLKSHVSAKSFNERLFLVAVLLIGVIVGAALTAGAIQSDSKINSRIVADHDANHAQLFNTGEAFDEHSSEFFNQVLTHVNNSKCQTLITVAKISSEVELTRLGQQNRASAKNLCCSSCHSGVAIDGFSAQQTTHFCRKCHAKMGIPHMVKIAS